MKSRDDPLEAFATFVDPWPNEMKIIEIQCHENQLTGLYVNGTVTFLSYRTWIPIFFTILWNVF